MVMYLKNLNNINGLIYYLKLIKLIHYDYIKIIFIFQDINLFLVVKNTQINNLLMYIIIVQLLILLIINNKIINLVIFVKVIINNELNMIRKILIN